MNAQKSAEFDAWLESSGELVGVVHSFDQEVVALSAHDSSNVPLGEEDPTITLLPDTTTRGDEARARFAEIRAQNAGGLSLQSLLPPAFPKAS